MIRIGLRSLVLALALVLGFASLPTERAGLLPAIAADTTRFEPLTLVSASSHESFRVELADDDTSRADGLMYRTKLGADEGMLFDFKTEQMVYFWMKNTYVPLDMIFIRSDGTVVSIAENATPLSEKPIGSAGPVRFVLEVNAGTSRRIGLKPGDHALHRLIKSNAG
ncbi:MAG: DUF192 domain-containing protein [Ancalomicrobiaceae bacterium]|nr:DUF192 domain-containing protein [Ancalomicrobiaceae bacterium]